MRLMICTISVWALLLAGQPVQAAPIKVDVEDIEWTAEHMPNLGVEVITGADHLTAFQRPEFIAAAEAFFLRHSANAN